MRLSDILFLGYTTLIRYPLRTIMLLIATSIGVMAVILLTAVGEGARDYITGEFRSLGTNLLIVSPGRNETSGGGVLDLAGLSPRPLTIEDAQSLFQIDNVRRIAPVVMGEAPAQYDGLERSAPIIGTTPEFLSIRQQMNSQKSQIQQSYVSLIFLQSYPHINKDYWFHILYMHLIIHLK